MTEIMMSKLRKIFLSMADFKELDDKEKKDGFRGIISSFLSNEDLS